METRWRRAAGAVLLALAAARATAAGYGASSYGGGPAVAKDAWPTALVERPLTLAQGLVELAAPVGVDLTVGGHGEPVNVPLAIHVGATDWLTLGVGHARGLCLSGPGGGCATAPDDLRVDALAQFHGSRRLAAGYGVALSVATLQGSPVLSGDAFLALRLTLGSAALVLAPTYGFGLTRREATRVMAETFPLATSLAFGTFETLPNRETVDFPLTALVQVGAHVALAAAVGVTGVLDPLAGRFTDAYRVPVGFAAVLSPLAMLDLGAGFTFPNLWGTREGTGPRSDSRVLEVFVALRPGARARRTAALLPAATAAAAASPATPFTIEIADLAFSPASLEVPVGATVTVRNRDAFPHSVTSEAARGAFEPGAVANVSFDTGAFSAGERSFTIPADAPPGTVVPFYCTVHRGGMRTPDGELRITPAR